MAEEDVGFAIVPVYGFVPFVTNEGFPVPWYFAGSSSAFLFNPFVGVETPLMPSLATGLLRSSIGLPALVLSGRLMGGVGGGGGFCPASPPIDDSISLKRLILV